MSGTKFRLSCSSCNATFFDADRRARYCPKCAKKKGTAPASKPVFGKATDRSERQADGPRKPLLGLRPPPDPPKEKKPQRPLKALEATPEHRAHIAQVYAEQLAGKEFAWKETVTQISDELWLHRKAVSEILREHHNPQIVAISDEVKAQIIELYKGFVERGERPEGGRRKTICKQFGLPFAQVRDIVYEYSMARYQESTNPETSREQKFELEKLLFAELEKARFKWNELPDKLVAQIPIFNSWQVARWMDMLFDDKPNVANASNVETEIEQNIVDAYKQYLTAPQPPEQGLHATLAEQIGGVSKTQVHKVLQNYRNRLKDNYPLK